MIAKRLKGGLGFEKLWHWLSFGVLVVAIGVTPLIFTTLSRELFEWPKMMLVYGLSMVAVALIWMRVVVDKHIVLPNRIISGSWLIYVGLFAVSTGLSMSIYTSLMGYYSRFHGGLASVLAYVAIAWLAYVYLSREPQDGGLMNRLKPLLYTWVGSASVISVWAVLEHFGRDFSCLLLTGTFDASCWVQDVQARVFATFGQPNWLATYLLTSLPLSLVFYLQSKGSNRWLWLAVVWLQFAGFWYTFSRSGWLGLAMVVVVLVACLPWSYFKERWRWVAVLVVGCVAIGLSSGQMVSQRTATSLESGDFDSSTGQMRLLVWQGSWGLIERWPWLGSGPETFAYSFLSERPTAMNTTTEWNFLYNKAHNEVLQTATDRGLVGLLSLIGVWASLMWVGWKSVLLDRRSKIGEMKVFGVAIFGGMAGVFVSQLFGFSVVMTGLLWWLGMVLVAALAEQDRGFKTMVWQIKGWRLGGLSLLIVMGVVVTGYGFGRLVMAEIYSTQAGKNNSIDNQLSRAPHLAVLLNPWEPYYQQQLASHYAGQATATEDEDRRGAVAEIALAYAEQAEDLNPFNLITKKQLGWTYSQLRPIGPRYAEAEIELWRRAVTLAPTDASSWLSLAKVYMEQKKDKDAEEAFSTLIELRPVGEVYGERAGFYEAIGQDEKAAADLAKAAELEPWNDKWHD